jgi:hypothetical protein
MQRRCGQRELRRERYMMEALVAGKDSAELVDMAWVIKLDPAKEYYTRK